MKINGTEIDDTFAEAFRMRFARILVTAVDADWVAKALREFTGYGTSIISCDAEAGRELELSADATPDGRPGAATLLFGFSNDGVAKAVANRAGQCLMTCPTTAAFDGLPDAPDRVPLGKHLRFFGDGFQKSKVIDGRRYWRVPVMDGEFFIQEDAGVAKGVAGGNIIIQGTTPAGALAAAGRAVEAIEVIAGVITPFPGGVVRSGSKVGSRYKQLRASTNEAFCPSLRGRASPTELHPEATCAYEIVIDGTDETVVSTAMREAIRAAAGGDVPRISAGNYGGKLGKFLLSLHEVMA